MESDSHNKTDSIELLHKEHPFLYQIGTLGAKCMELIPEQIRVKVSIIIQFLALPPSDPEYAERRNQ